ncbi:uncharacterized protein LOC143519476 [Brachyhypopomus gauderio]|uniref:uncharacterized protein LOC143519476 n=1 Tax=Brachyhypopomus gauderio TaxID=698409 RepID=UPI004042FF24
MLIEMPLHPSWLLVLVLQFLWPSMAVNFTVVPQNVTVALGKSASFQCGISSPKEVSFNFTVCRPEANYTLTCPGRSINFQTLSLSGYCQVNNTEALATWDLSTVGSDSNGIHIVCHTNGLTDKHAYLFIDGSSKYYAMLFGCVMGGFFGILIVFAVTYITLKKSEKFQTCFKGKEEDDIPTVAENTNQY